MTGPAWKDCCDESDFGRAVSRILSASLRTERIICLSSPYPEPVRFRELRRAVARFPIWPCTRWGLPCRVACASRGALLPHLFTLTGVLRRRRYILCGTVRRKASPLFLPRVSPAEPELRGIAPCSVRTFLPPLARRAILHPPKITGKVRGCGACGKELDSLGAPVSEPASRKPPTTSRVGDRRSKL
jgi:hypothetical protein